MSKTQSSTPPQTGKIWIEVCLISARGLHRSSLWKLHWFAVGWVDPNDKYLTRIDSSGNPNPVWRTKFTAELSSKDNTLHVEVYSRDPIFLREKLYGSTAISLREFLAKHGNCSEGSAQGKEDVGSFQLRRKSSGKPQGFVDISIRTSLEKERMGSIVTDHMGFQLTDNHQEITLPTGAEAVQAHPTSERLPQVPFSHPPNHPLGNYPYPHPTPYPSKYANPAVAGPSYPPASGPSYPPERPPPPPSHAGYVQTFIPRAENTSYSYMNLPPSGGAYGNRPGGAPAFAAGMGAGALAAGAVIFGDDIMSGFGQMPSGPSLIISADPPF